MRIVSSFEHPIRFKNFFKKCDFSLDFVCAKYYIYLRMNKELNINRKEREMEILLSGGYYVKAVLGKNAQKARLGKKNRALVEKALKNRDITHVFPTKKGILVHFTNGVELPIEKAAL